MCFFFVCFFFPHHFLCLIGSLIDPSSVYYHYLPLIGTPLTTDAKVLVDWILHVAIKAKAFSCKQKGSDSIMCSLQTSFFFFLSLGYPPFYFTPAEQTQRLFSSVRELLISSYFNDVVFFSDIWAMHLSRFLRKRLKKFSSRNIFNLLLLYNTAALKMATNGRWQLMKVMVLPSVHHACRCFSDTFDRDTICETLAHCHTVSTYDSSCITYFECCEGSYYVMQGFLTLKHS